MNGFLQDTSSGECIELADTLVIGRREDCDLVLNDVKISRRHAMIRPQDGRYWLYDLGSSNGSFLNGKRVPAATQLTNADELRFGPFGFRFISPDAADPAREGAGGDDTYDLAATIADIRTVPVTVFVSDLKGFTRLSERVPPDALAGVMGEWYRECNRVLGARGASLDKFIGDCVLAYWMATDHVTRGAALLAARDLVAATERIVAPGEDEPALSAGAGIHIGSVAHGAMGQGAFTLLGDTVNATFRLEALTRKLQRDILVSGEFLSGWDAGEQLCQPLGEHAVDGRSVPLEVYSVESFPAEPDAQP